MGAGNNDSAQDKVKLNKNRPNMTFEGLTNIFYIDIVGEFTKINRVGLVKCVSEARREGENVRRQR